jgi:phage tail tape-measure protein
MKNLKTIVVIATLGLSSACLAADPVVKSAIGGGLGGAAGAAVGQEVGGKKGAVVGGAVGGALGGAAGAAIGCDVTSNKKPQQAAAKPVPAAVTVAATPAYVEASGGCGRKHNKGKGWAKGHTKC